MGYSQWFVVIESLKVIHTFEWVDNGQGDQVGGFYGGQSYNSENAKQGDFCVDDNILQSTREFCAPQIHGHDGQYDSH